MAIAVSAKEFPFYKAQVPLFPLAQHSSDLIANSFANTCPATGYPFCSSGISYNGQTLQGTASTVVFNFSPYGFAQNCSTSATMSGPGVLETAADTAACFERNTSVLLESENAQPSSVYCINAVHVGATGGGTTSDCLITPGPKVLSVNYELIHTDDLPIDANPNAGGGLRIFPDKKTPNETVDRRRIRVKAQYSQMTAGIRIYFRNFDVDDPSADTAPIDANDNPSVKAGNDNRGNVDGNSSTKAGVLTAPSGSSGCQTYSSGLSCLTDSSGIATVDFVVTMQPGDNFSVVASPDEDYINGLALVEDGINLGDPNDFEIPVTTSSANTCESTSQKACRSDILTIWRRLHIEEDSMGVVSGNFVSGTIIGAIQTTSDTRLLSSVPLEEWRYEPGIIVIDQIGTFAVTDNTSDEIVSDSQISPEDALGKSFVLYDDDDYNKTNPVIYGDNNEDVNRTETTFSRMQTSDDPEKNVFVPAYILPIYDGGGSLSNNQSDIQFVQNLNETQALSQINLGRSSGNAETDRFWVIYVQIAYQPESAFDRDPDTDRDFKAVQSTLGGTPVISVANEVPSDCSDLPIGGHGSFIFQEVVRDEFDLFNLADNGLTLPHEVGHQMGIDGDGAGQKIMSSALDPEPSFIPQHLHLIRCRVKSPGQS